MIIENLKEGMEVKNYKALCDIIDIKITSGESKIAQIKELERYIKFHKEGQRFIIDKVYNQIKEKIDKRVDSNKFGKNKNHLKEFESLKIDKTNYNNIGVYRIILNNDIYIGSTLIGFRERFKQHNCKGKSNLSTAKEMLNNGAIFEILWISEINDEEYVRYKENQFIKQYKKDKNWNVINTNEAWNKIDGSKSNKVKFENRLIRIKNENYDKVMNLLKENNLI